MRGVSQSIEYMDHFVITASLSPSRTGLYIDLIFENRSLLRNMQPPTVVVLFPINGYLTYAYRTPEGQVGVIVGQIYDISAINPEIYEFLLPPGERRETRFYVKVPMEHIERMKDIADRDGTVTLNLVLYFSILYNTTALISAFQKIYKLHPVFTFNVPKAIIEEWVARWMESYAQFHDFSHAIPKEVLSDYIEAVKSFNVGAYKAAVAMARRALQQALEDKGAEPRKRLLDQIDELKDKGIIDKATASLAHGIRQFGNYGAHPQTDLLAQITRDDAKLVLDVTKRILKVLYRIQ